MMAEKVKDAAVNLFIPSSWLTFLQKFNQSKLGVLDFYWLE